MGANGNDDPIGLVMAGFDGPEPTPAVLSLVRQGLAGVILFTRNLVDGGQTAELTRRLQEAAAAAGQPPLLIAADQEGGRVRRLRRGLSAFPSAMALGAAADCPEVYRLCRAVAGELASVGINLNFAPCADVNSDPRNPVIGTRSFGDVPSAVARMVAAAVRGYQDGGVLACAKHFPGHGHTELDSHLTLPAIRRSLDELRQVELVPFGAAIAAGVAAVMSAHIVVPALTGDAPATLSPVALTRLLRDELGHQGLILTDCMEMAAVRGGPAGDATIRAVAAGADLVLWSHTPELQSQAIEALRAAAGTAALPPGRLRASLERVRRAREGLGRADAAKSTAGRADADASAAFAALGPGSEVAERARRLALAAVTAVGCRGSGPGALERESPGGRGAGGAGPRVYFELPRERPVLIYDLTGLPGTPDEAGPGEALTGEMTLRGYRVRLVQFPKPPGAHRGAGTAADPVKDCDPLPPLAGGRPARASVICLTHSACLRPDQAAAHRAVLTALPHAVTVATGLPYDLALLPHGVRRGGLCTYDPGPASMWACAGVLSGASRATGRLPVRLGVPCTEESPV